MKIVNLYSIKAISTRLTSRTGFLGQSRAVIETKSKNNTRFNNYILVSRIE